MRVDANGIAFNCEIEGPESAPWLTFSNSLATNLAMWDAQAQALRHDFRVLRYDKRGHGGTQEVAGPYTIDMLVGDVVAIWDALGIARSHFVGLSIGGMTAMGLGFDHPDRVLSLVISNSRADATQESRDAWDQRIATAETAGMAALAGPTVERWCSKPFLASGAPALAALRAMVASTSVSGFVGCGRALQKLDYERRIGEIAAPTLFIAGHDDAGTPAANMRRLSGLVRGAEYVELSPAGHISCMEQPETYTRTLREFLDAV